MRQHFNWFLGKPLTHEIRSLVDAINADQVKWNGECCDDADTVTYNGVKVCAYLVNTNFGYTVDIGFLSNCLPRHEARAVYKALVRFRKRRIKRHDDTLRDIKREDVRKALNCDSSFQ